VSRWLADSPPNLRITAIDGSNHLISKDYLILFQTFSSAFAPEVSAGLLDKTKLSTKRLFTGTFAAKC
jgi:hypothetical protein